VRAGLVRAEADNAFPPVSVGLLTFIVTGTGCFTVKLVGIGNDATAALVGEDIAWVAPV
jgi:hypothetical protein